MMSEKDRTQFAVKVFLALFFIVLIGSYNSAYYSVSRNYNLKYLKLSLSLPLQNKTEGDVQTNDTINANTEFNITNNIQIAPRPKGYLVWSENCHMPSMDPFDSKYMEHYNEKMAPICSTKQPLVTKSYNKIVHAYILHINVHLKDQYLNETTNDDINCCYKQVLRNGDKQFKLLKCTPFGQNFLVPNNIDYMLIECGGTKNTTVIYEDGLTLIQERRAVNEKLHANSKRGRPFGILMFGIDTVSQFNVRRVMPKTFEYVQNRSWFELSGYNKV